MFRVSNYSEKYCKLRLLFHMFSGKGHRDQTICSIWIGRSGTIARRSKNCGTNTKELHGKDYAPLHAKSPHKFPCNVLLWIVKILFCFLSFFSSFFKVCVFCVHYPMVFGRNIFAYGLKKRFCRPKQFGLLPHEI